MLWNLWKVVRGLRMQQSRVYLVGGTTVLDASWYRLDSRLVTIDEQGMLVVSYQVS